MKKKPAIPLPANQVCSFPWEAATRLLREAVGSRSVLASRSRPIINIFAKSPEPEKIRMMASNYDRVINFFTAFSDLFVSVGYVQRDTGLRLLLDSAADGFLQSIRDVFTHRKLFLDSYLQTVHKVSRLPRPAPVADSQLTCDFGGSYRYLFEEAPQPQDPENESDSLVLAALEEDRQPRAGLEPVRRSVAFVKLLFAALPCSCNGQYFVAVFQIRPERIDMFYNLSLIEDPFGFRDLCLCLDLRIYAPGFLATHKVEVQKLELGSLPERSLEVARKSMLAFYKTLKPTFPLLKLLTNVLRARIARIDSDKVVLKRTPNPYTDELLAQEIGWEPSAAPAVAGHKILVATDSIRELFAKQIRAADIEIRQKSGEVFLKHYNTVKRIFGKQKFYLNVKYQNKTYQVRIRYVETQPKCTLCSPQSTTASRCTSRSTSTPATTTSGSSSSKARRGRSRKFSTAFKFQTPGCRPTRWRAR